MRVLILDTIHGGQVIAKYLSELGNTIDTVDVYRDGGTLTIEEAQAGLTQGRYELIIHPVHLAANHPLLHTAWQHNVCTKTHHETVAWILSEWGKSGQFIRPRHMIEITGARGKTTTAYALAACLSQFGPGILHSSAGIFVFAHPARSKEEKVGHLSITPASVLTVARKYWQHGMTWLICEESLGVTGYHDCAILTSDRDYKCAAGTESALKIKQASLINSPCALIPNEAIKSEKEAERQKNMISVQTIVQVSGELAEYHYNAWDGICTNPLFYLSQYREPLMLAIAASVTLDVDPQGINTFKPVPGRLSLKTIHERTVLDDANSGTTEITAIEAARYLRGITHSPDIILCIGQDAHAVCENLTEDNIITAQRTIKPIHTILVSGGLSKPELITAYLNEHNCSYNIVSSLNEAQELIACTDKHEKNIPVLLAVKTWR
jgi:UDP-N-acetylmuramyl pentapeptide synthase